MSYAQSVVITPSDTTLLKPRLYLNLNQGVKKYDFKYSLKSDHSRTYADQLPFFCKMEHKLSVNARIPVRIRLGSLDYVNKLEGKGN
jgi:hypothetical protein